MNILLTQISRIGALCWLKCLHGIKSMDIVTYGTDTQEIGYSAGSQLVDNYIQISPDLTDNEYLDVIYNLCYENSIDMLISVIDDELELFLKNKQRFEKYLFCLEYEIFNLFHDKLQASLEMQKIGIAIPPIVNNPFGKKKVIFRDKVSIGSRGIYVIDLTKEKYIENRFQNNRFMQQFIEGEEFTVDVLTDKTGTPLLMVPRKRIEIKQGVSFICQLKNDKQIINACKKIYTYYKIPGISNVQFIRNEEDLYFIELNPRLGGTSIASILGGFNFIELYLQHNIRNIPIKPMEDYQKLIAWDSIISRDYNEYIFMK